MLNARRSEMVDAIFEMVRCACRDCDISFGAIGVGTVLEKRSRALFEWAGSPECANCEISTAPIAAGGDTLCFDENGKLVEDGEGTVLTKIAGLRRQLIFYDEEQIVPTRLDQYTSSALPDRSIIPGLSNQKGAIAVRICARDIGGYGFNDGSHAITFYVAVSSGAPEKDEAAAWKALDYIRDEVEKSAGHDLVLEWPFRNV